MSRMGRRTKLKRKLGPLVQISGFCVRGLSDQDIDKWYDTVNMIIANKVKLARECGRHKLSIVDSKKVHHSWQ